VDKRTSARVAEKNHSRGERQRIAGHPAMRIGLSTEQLGCTFVGFLFAEANEARRQTAPRWGGGVWHGRRACAMDV
jgi:hypothetical protein